MSIWRQVYIKSDIRLLKELDTALSVCKGKSAPSLDWIPSEYIKMLPQAEKLYLLNIYNEIWINGKFLYNW